MPTMSTARFVHLKNLQLLRDRLLRTTDDAQCKRIVKMIEDEEAKDHRPPNDYEQ